MSRSVSKPQGAIQVAYAACDVDDSDDFADCIDNLKGVAQHRYKSLSSCDRWLGREDHAILENSHAYIGVSEYCGLVAVWIVAKEDRYGNASSIANYWCDQVKLAPLAECFGQRVRPVGCFSNGECVFQQV